MLLASNIGPMLAQYCVQYWPNNGHNIAPIWAALHNDNIGQYFGPHWVNIGHKYWTNISRICCTILSQYWVKIVTILASTHSYDIPPILQGNIVPPLTILLTILDRMKAILFQIHIQFQDRSYTEA